MQHQHVRTITQQGGRAGACLSSQWGWVWTAGGRALCRGPESRVAGGQLLAPTPANRAGAPGSILVMLALLLAKVRPGCRSQKSRCSKRGWAGETTSGQGQRGHRFTQHTRARTTHAQANAHARTAWPRGKGCGSPICTQTSHMLWAPPSGVGQRGPPGGLLGPTVGGGVSLGVRTQCEPPVCLGFLAQYGGQETPIDSPVRLAEVRAAVERLDRWTDGGLDRATCAQRVNK